MIADDLKSKFKSDCDCGCNRKVCSDFLRSGGNLAVLHNFLISKSPEELLANLPSDATLLGEQYIECLISSYRNDRRLVIREKLVERMEEWGTEYCLRVLKELSVTDPTDWLRDYCARVINQYE